MSKIKINIKKSESIIINPNFTKNYIPIDEDLPLTEPVLSEETPTINLTEEKSKIRIRKK